MAEGRVVRLKVKTHMDGKSEVGVEMTEHAGGEDFVVCVRPKGLRTKYEMNLSDVVQIIQQRCVKLDLQAQGKNVPRPRR